MRESDRTLPGGRLRGLMLVALLLAMTLLAGLSPATSVASSGAADFPEAQLQEYLERTARAIGLPSLCVEVSYRGETVFAYARGEGVTTDTLFYIGSISKSFTALAIMQLVESGSIDLDSPVSRYLPEFRVSEQITVRHLLNQVSGMTDLDYIPALPWEATFDDLIADMNTMSLRHVPGTTFAYFNQNYSLLGAMVEKVSGQAYETYVQERILNPLGLERTYLRGEVDVTGHLSAFTMSVPRYEPFPQYDLPGGYISSSISDLVKYLNMMATQDAKLGVSRAGLELMMQTDPYGMGWMWGTIAGRPAVHHGGSLPGYVANSVMLTEDGYNIALMTNKNQLLYSLFFYPDLTRGIVSIITDQQPPDRLYLAWVFRALLPLAALNLFFAYRKSWRLFRGATPMPRAKRITRIALNLVIPVAIIMLIPNIVAVVLGRGMTWQLAFYMMPDMLIWMTLGILSNVAEAAAHLYLLARVD